ncbi:hypothetical protein [Bradyrhizobium elkanii]|uniref:hypothetical protein n=1 Tax=Bradyrhizobium elkanii TaxID=29448 RepID=UPI00048296E6|nr:hypothetical protein [Bradyrhizobium elkanii]
MTKKRVDTELAEEKSAFASFPIVEDVYPIVVMPADVKASIARAAAAEAVGEEIPADTTKDLPHDFRTAVTDQDVQDARDRHFNGLEAAGKGKRQQPRMINRLRATDVFVQREIADGTLFAVGPNSTMHRKVREWLNGKAARTKDNRKSRRKRIADGAVRALLRQIRALRGATGD